MPAAAVWSENVVVCAVAMEQAMDSVTRDGKAWEWLRFFALYPGMFYRVVELWEPMLPRFTGSL